MAFQCDRAIRNYGPAGLDRAAVLPRPNAIRQNLQKSRYNTHHISIPAIQRLSLRGPMPPKSSSKIIKSINEGKSFFWHEYMKEVQQGNDRATAILGAVYLDEYLREYLESVLVEEKSLSDEI